MGSRPTNGCGYVCKCVYQKGSAVMLTSIQSEGLAPEVNLRITQARKHAKEFTLAWKTRADVTKRGGNRGYQWPHKKNF